ncbi:MAG TPA: methyl-accepting chemotaxis protein [Pseudomonadota bacterium]|nr:methyl-accepting chemotaxis protein [Pseudomonadota bacterium]
MSNLSIRVRLFLLVGLFSLVSVLISIAGIIGVSSMEEEIFDLMDTVIEARRSTHNLYRDFEHLNGLSNMLITLDADDDPSAIFHDQDRLLAEMETQLGSLNKLLNTEDAAVIEQIRALFDDYKRRNAKLRKLVASSATDKAISAYLGEHEEQVQKLREILLRATTELDQGHPQAGQAARELHITLATLNGWLGQMPIESSDAKLAELLRRINPLLEKLPVALAQLAESDPVGQRLALRLSPMIESYRKSAIEIARLALKNDQHQMNELVHKGNTSIETARAILRQLQAKLLSQVDAKHARIQRTNVHTRSFFIMAAVVGIIVAGTFAFFTTRRIYNGVQGIQRVVRQVTDASTQIRTATQSMAQRTSEEASSLEETSSTMEEMAATVEQNRNGASRARELAERNGEAAQKNFEITSQAAQAMTSLKQAGTKISEISETVTEIAFQTNILALNAAVEAARAGDHGRGFAVVATEVRTLAQRTGLAAREISELIKDSLQRMERAVDLVDRSAVEIERMVDSSREYISLVANINAAAQEQASGIGQVTQSVMQLNTVVQSNSAQAEEMAAAAENLMFQAEELQRALGLIAGVSEQEPGRPPSAGLRLPLHRALSKPGGEAQSSAPIHSSPRDSDFATF